MTLPLAEAGSMGPLPAVMFYLFAAMTVGAAFSVALARNIVRAAVGLMFALAGVSGLYLMLNAEFIAAVQLVVYVGGTLILIVFGVMLTSKSPNSAYSPKRWEIAWASVVTLLVILPLAVLMSKFPVRATDSVIAATHSGASATNSGVAATSSSVAATVSADGSKATGEVGDRYQMASLGRALLEPAGYLVPFEMVSVVLLAVMIGAAYLAKGRTRKSDEKGAGK